MYVIASIPQLMSTSRDSTPWKPEGPNDRLCYIVATCTKLEHVMSEPRLISWVAMLATVVIVCSTCSDPTADQFGQPRTQNLGSSPTVEPGIAVPTGTPTPFPTSITAPVTKQLFTGLATPSPTRTPTPMSAGTPTPLPSNTPTLLPTSSPTPLPTANQTTTQPSTPVRVPTVTPTNTPAPTSTSVPTAAPTQTAIPTPTPRPEDVVTAHLSEAVPWFRDPIVAYDRQAAVVISHIWILDRAVGDAITPLPWFQDGMSFAELDAMVSIRGIARLDTGLAHKLALKSWSARW